jgi:hypothetical protein
MALKFRFLFFYKKFKFTSLFRHPLSNLAFASVENGLYKARRRTLPAVPSTLLELVALVQMDARY